MAMAVSNVFGGSQSQSQSQSASHGVVFLADPTRWGAWAHRGHRLWASMSEEFWVHVYKVQRCPQPVSHDWTSCPYAHKGERARRRDPRRFAYAAVSCPDYRPPQPGAPPSCARGLRCGYAHGVFELWLHPSRFRTRMCEAGPRCPRRICFFAHFAAELRDEVDAAASVLPSPPTPRILRRAVAIAASPPPPPPPPPQLDRLLVRAMPTNQQRLGSYCHAAGASSSSSPATGGALPLPNGGEGSSAPRCTCCFRAEEDSIIADEYPHLDLIMEMMGIWDC